ncbi:unnamed protein product [Linum trigynum]|uniref:Uncharacterized protein n=1 Tax=Linum trigynum TaxID=586398 RepID=A0AAV2GBZ8_9ROSI
MSFRKLQKEDFLTQPTAQNVPCSVSAKRSSALCYLDDEEEGVWRPEIATKVFHEVERTTNSQEEAPDQAEVDRTPPSTSSPELCHVSAKQSMRENELVGAMGDWSSPTNEAYTFPSTPRTSLVDSLERNKHDIEDSIRAKSLLFTTVNSCQNSFGHIAIECESTPTTNEESIKTMPRSYWDERIELEMPEVETPKSQSTILGFGHLKTDDGGKGWGAGSARMVTSRDKGPV